jgi:hypothetical protein
MCHRPGGIEPRAHFKDVIVGLDLHAVRSVALPLCRITAWRAEGSGKPGGAAPARATARETRFTRTSKSPLMAEATNHCTKRVFAGMKSSPELKYSKLRPIFQLLPLPHGTLGHQRHC